MFFFYLKIFNQRKNVTKRDKEIAQNLQRKIIKEILFVFFAKKKIQKKNEEQLRKQKFNENETELNRLLHKLKTREKQENHFKN